MNYKDIEREFERVMPKTWWWSIGAGTGEHKDNYDEARSECLAFLKTTLKQAMESVVVEEKKIQRPMADAVSQRNYDCDVNAYNTARQDTLNNIDKFFL